MHVPVCSPARRGASTESGRCYPLLPLAVKSRIIALVLCTAAASCALNPRARSHPTADAVIAEVSVRAHLEFLASDAMNGRGSGTSDEWIAATYLASQMQRLGLEPLGDNGGYVKTVDVERVELASAPILSFADDRLAHGQEMIVQVMASARASGPLHKYAEGTPVPRGAIVLLPAGAGQQAASASSQAAAILAAETPQVRARWEVLAAPPTSIRRLGQSPGAFRRPSRIALDKQAYGKIAALVEGTTLTLEAEIKGVQTSQTWNAVGRLRGADAVLGRDVILLSAHLDHIGARPGAAGTDTIYNGADDDASGCVAVLELARALTQGPPPKRTIVFAFFGSEESGGLGSWQFAEAPPAPLAQIVANLQFEMIGRPDPAVAAQTLWLTGYERSTLGPALVQHGARLVQDPHPAQNFFERSDNIQFARRGVIAHTVSSYGLHKEYHTPADEVRLVDFAHMTNAIQSLLEPIRWLANSDFKPEWVPGKKP
jgi:aminopeptidase YwaD